MEQIGSHWADFDDILYLSFLSKICQKIRFQLNMTRITVVLLEDIFIFMTIFRLILLVLGSISDKVVEKIKTYFMFRNFFKKIAPVIR